MDPEVKDNPERHRFEILVDGEVAGFAAYRLRENALVFTHTEIEPDFEGQGLGSRLASGALDTVRARGQQAYVQCPFISGYIERHPEYKDLVITG